MSKNFLAVLLHGESKVGKSTLAATAHMPLVVLDAEDGGLRFVEGKKVVWDPTRGAPPEGYDIYQVRIKSMSDIDAVYKYLSTYEHPFKSVVLDSISELQARMKRDVATKGSMQIQDWGVLYEQIENMMWQFVALVQHETSPLDMFIMISGSELASGKFRPMIQGKMAKKLSYKVDISGYLMALPDENGTLVRGLRTQGNETIEAGERVGGRLDAIEWNPNLTDLFTKIFGGTAEESQTEGQ